MTNYEKHNYLRDEVLAHLQTAKFSLSASQARRNQLDEQLTLDAICYAIQAVQGQMSKYVTTI